MSDHHKEQFWISFLESSSTVREHIHAKRMRAAFELVEELLLAHGYDFAFELTAEGASSVLVLTPEGDIDRARYIDELLSSRPEVPGWKFFGRRQRKEFEDALTFVRHIYGRDAGDVIFQASHSNRGHDVTVITQAMAGLSPDVAHGLAVTLLDHALGEDVVMSKVSAIRAAMPARRYENPVLSLPQLATFLDSTG